MYDVCNTLLKPCLYCMCSTLSISHIFLFNILEIRQHHDIIIVVSESLFFMLSDCVVMKITGERDI